MFYKVEYECGTSRYGDYVVDYMICKTPYFELYSEIPINDNDIDEYGIETNIADDFHYRALKGDIISQAIEYGVKDELSFLRG